MFWAAILCYVVAFAMLASFWMGTQFDPTSDETTYQAALHISNWTNRTLDIDIYVFGSDTVLFSVTDLEHEENVTVTVTWQEVKGTITFLHCVGEDIDGWCVYELDPGQWRSVVLW